MVWRKGHQVLAAGPMLLIKDDRFKLGADNTLELTDIQPQDAGDFVCQISLKAGETLEIAHTVEVLGKKPILHALKYDINVLHFRFEANLRPFEVI